MTVRLCGRKAELAEIEGLLERAEAGLSGVLVVQGAAGIGKTVLLEHAVTAVSGFLVTRVSGVEAEHELGFAALHRLLLPCLGERGRLPSPQRQALETAFGLLNAAPPDRFLVGLATLTLLAEAASDRPLLAVCDDVQWMDRESLVVLAFVARRLHAEGVVMLFGARDEGEAADLLAGLDGIRLEGLTDDDAHTLFAAVSGGAVDRVVAARSLTRTGGNPLAIREAARALALDPAAAMTTDPELGGPLPLGLRLQRRFLSQVGTLDPVAQRVLLVLAADTSGSLDLVRRASAAFAAASLTEVDDAFGTAVARELVNPVGEGGQVAFRHPLIRSAVYGDAAPARRRAAHAALAVAADPVRDRDRRACHLAAAADGPDETVAAELEAGALRARERGGHLAQAALLHRAAELTPPGPLREDRLLSACGAALTAGAPHLAERLLARRSAAPADALSNAHAWRLRGFLNVMLGREGAVGLLLDAARVLAAHDPAAGRDTLLEAFDAATVVGRLGPGMSILNVARTTLETAAPDMRAVPDLLLRSHAELVAHGYLRAVPLMRRGVAAMLDEGAENGDAARWFLLGVMLAYELWDIDAAGECARRYAAAARRQGALRMLQASAAGAGVHALLCGRASDAEAHYAEFRDVAAAIGADPALAEANDVLLHAWRGDRERTLAAVAVHAGPDAESPGGLQVQLARTALVHLELGSCRYGPALAAARAVFDEDPPHFGGIVLPDLVEAAVRHGEPTTAAAALERLAERATAAATPWALGVLARSRALLLDGQDAERHYLRALHLLGETAVAAESARTHLLYGEWLRRRRRRADAREHLREAHTMFARMGAAAFADRAHAELTATGEHARVREPGTARDLTSQELRVARLAAGGSTNQEIAAELFISASTVEYHLRKVFRKLGITSRRQLRPGLPLRSQLDFSLRRGGGGD